MIDGSHLWVDVLHSNRRCLCRKHVGDMKSREGGVSYLFIYVTTDDRSISETVGGNWNLQWNISATVHIEF